MPIAKVSHKFQVVIPKEIRDILNISRGDTLEVYEKNHEVIMKKSQMKRPLNLRDLKGLGKEIWKDVDVEDYVKKERESWQNTDE